MQQQPALERPLAGRWRIGGLVGRSLTAARDEWLLKAPLANPSMLQMFHDRDRRPRRKLVPWAGEFIGKHLTAAALTAKVATDPRLISQCCDLVRRLIAVQDTDGYLGPHPRSERLTGKTANGDALWDIWGHYHVILGLILWADHVPEARGAACRIGDLICRTFLDADVPLTVAGAEEMNMAIGHGMCLLHRETGEPRYLEMALRTLRDWEIPPAGDYLRAALAGKEFHECPKPRWESLHDLLALPELYALTGEQKYRTAFEHFWWSILEGDRHNTGGFTSGEQAVGNPYATGAIETCCTVAWIAMSVEMLRLTGDPRVADEIELSTLNGAIGGMHPSGRWWTYNTPMDGVKRASAHDIVFQAHPGGPELNCCSVNAPRGPAMLADWALMQAPDGVALNYYGPSTLEADLPSGNRLRLHQRSTYPKGGTVTLTIGLQRPEEFALSLRIPQWSAQTIVTVNGEPVASVTPGTYLHLSRAWQDGDAVHFTFDMSFHYWVGEREQEGKCSIYRGPLLLAYDQAFNEMDPDDVPPLDGRGLKGTVTRSSGWPDPWVLLSIPTADGRGLVLCDFATAGARGTEYRSWLPITGLIPRPFSRERPVWNVRSDNN